MKKFIFAIILSFISIMSFAQKPSLCVYGEGNGLPPVYAGVNSKQEVVLWFTTIACGDSDYSYFVINGVKNIDKLNKEFIFLKEKMIEYNKIAEENNINEIEKIICDMKGWGNGHYFVWDNSYEVGLFIGNKLSNYVKAKYILRNGTSYIKCDAWSYMVSNKYVKVYSQIILTLDNIDKFINLTSDYNNLVNLVNKNAEKYNLFN